MVFSHESALRTLRVRTVLSIVALGICGTAFYFVYAREDPRHGCAECIGITYREGDIPQHYVALTFDDGPHENATPRLLDVLDARQAPATFFMLGQLVVRSPGLVREVHERGYEIGNHTFTHEESIHKSERRIMWELNTTNALIESLIGSSATLYRPPFLLDTEDFEVTPEGLNTDVWDWVREHGYVPVGADLDSLDWQVSSPEGVLANVQKIIDVKKNDPDAATRHVILFHDEPHTAEALDEAITLLRANGFEIVPLSSLLGMTRAETMPAAQTGPRHLFYLGFMYMMAVLHPLAVAVVTVVVLITFARPILFVWIKELTKNRARVPRRTGKKGPLPTVAVLIPVYNEGANVRATIESIMHNTRVPDEVVVINDGSTDDTEVHANELAARYPDVVRVVTLQNGGKARALNIGLANVASEVVVCIDGDTVLSKNCLESVLPHFLDPTVGAVSGKIVPASTSKLIERFQQLEYMVGQNLEKHALGAAGAVNVVPGAIGAWRRDALKLAGGYSTDTLVEDQDLSLALLKEGYSVLYEPRAVGYTEVPSTVKGLMLQRIRWTYGTFQCVYKYRAYVLSEDSWRLGFLALPYAALFNVTLPVVTLTLHAGILLAVLMRLTNLSILFFFIYVFVDIAYTAYALREEKRSVKALLPLVPLQRFFFILFYTLVVAHVVVKVLDGSRTRWNKLKRNGSAQRLYEESLDPLFLKPRPVAVTAAVSQPAPVPTS